eukprot:13046543-Alexandrium_andersonii.AAC.1
MPHRRACARQSSARRMPSVKGDLRAFRPSRSLAHRQYFCPSCVEGGLGPFDGVWLSSVPTRCPRPVV